MAVDILLDLGASRIKAGLYDDETRSILAERDVEAPTPRFGSRGEVEIPGEAYAPLVEELCSDLIRRTGVAIGKMAICSEMHGFALESAGQPVSYVSWRDERAVQSGILGQLQDELGPAFRSITGMRLRPGLPFVTLAHMARHGGLPTRSRLYSLPDLLISRLGVWNGTIDESMAAGLGLYDLDGRSWSPVLLDQIGAAETLPDLARPAATGEAELGTVIIAGQEVPVMVACGDLQAAVYGSECSAVTALCVNIGTGSQVNRIGVRPATPFVEERPFPKAGRMATISHIPAGRAFRVFESFFRELGKGEEFWRIAAALDVEQVEMAELRLDLNVFAGAWRYRDGGSIAGIREGGFTPQALVAGAVKALVTQYAEAIDLMDPQSECDRIILAGGMPRRIPAFASILGRMAGREAVASPRGEETLNGLIRLLGEGGDE